MFVGDGVVVVVNNGFYLVYRWVRIVGLVS